MQGQLLSIVLLNINQAMQIGAAARHGSAWRQQALAYNTTLLPFSTWL